MAIYIVQHRPYWKPDGDHYYSIEVGAVNHSNHFGDFRDDLGDNISNRNSVWCELTALYWIFKNDIVNTDYVGLCHYRRYFAFGLSDNLFVDKYIKLKNKKQKTPYMKIGKQYIDTPFFQKIISTDIIKTYLTEYDIILPKPTFLNTNVQENFEQAHGKVFYDIMKQVVHEYSPEYDMAFQKVSKRKYEYFFNMFVTSKSAFSKYAEWLFPILFDIEKKIEIPKDVYQKRIIGFMAERLLNIWVYKNNLKIKEVPLAFLCDDDTLKRKAFFHSVKAFD